MRAAVISLGSTSSKWTADELAKNFDEVDMLDIKQFDISVGKVGEILWGGKVLKKYDCVYAKGSFRYANLLRSITTLLSKHTYLPVSPDAFTLAHDKILTHLKLQEFDIPMPKTYFASSATAAKKIVRSIPCPIIIKMPAGTHGKGVMFADSQESASTMIDALSLLNQPFLLQEYIDTDGEDLRAMVVGNEVVATMKRCASKGETRANIHAGGEGKKVTLCASAKKIAIKAARALGCDICAVDLLESIKGTMVLEVNISPGLQAITNISGINVAAKIAKYLFKRAKSRKDKHTEKGKNEIIDDLNPTREIILTLDFRGNRILLPEYVAKLTKLRDDEEVILTVKNGKFGIEKF